ncbi:hypothetical protein [Larkinella rosea]|uniref:Tetratricopeptide repeat protein n=1 Tax=Larkinella rosea TaxID=2025312 RepID=A0A3P1BTS7_9BACT|nr:hypothetical protein [Larkinella rosea]RRB04422.1 hypothetical protein EHT25_13050 [Larkinella rosea]
MSNVLHHSILILLLFFATVPPARVIARTLPAVVDEEYDRYKKRGDDFFKEGKYFEARRQYQNCLEVPGFETDEYATKQIEVSTTGLELRQKVDEAASQGKNQQVVDLLYQLLNLNPDDVLTKSQFADHYEREGNQLFNQKKYREARTNYTAAIQFASANKKETLLIQVRNIDVLLQPTYPNRIGLKAVTGVVAVGAGIAGLVLRSNYNSKVRALNGISQQADPDGTGIIADRDMYRQYDEAYTAAEAARQKSGLSKACLGVAAVATLAEAYLFLHKPKPRQTAFHWQPSADSWGLAIRYTF